MVLSLTVQVANIDPYGAAADAERALKSKDRFRECAEECPEMIVVPAGNL